MRAGFAIGELVEVHHRAGGAGGDVPGLLYVRCVKHPPQ